MQVKLICNTSLIKIRDIYFEADQQKFLDYSVISSELRAQSTGAQMLSLQWDSNPRPAHYE